MLALGLAGGSSSLDLEDDCRLEDCFCGEAPLMAASKNSRSLSLRNICVGVLRTVKCWLVMHSEGIAVGVFACTKIPGVKR